MKKKILGLMALALLVFAPMASAGSFTYNLNQAGFGIGSVLTPYGVVSYSDAGTGVVNFSVKLAPALGWINTGLYGSFVFNVDKSVSNLALSGQAETDGWRLVGPQDATPPVANEDGFGPFQYAINCPADVCGNGGSSPIFDTLSFVLTGPDLTAADFNYGWLGGDGSWFAADVYSRNSGMTGAIGGGSGTPVPEPASMLLLGSGLLGAGFFGRRRKKN